MSQRVFQKVRTSYKRARGFGNYYLSDELGAPSFADLRKSIEQHELYPHSAKLGRLPSEEQIKTLCVPKTCFRTINNHTYWVQSSYLGLDYTRRFGNYISHALVWDAESRPPFHFSDLLLSDVFLQAFDDENPPEVKTLTLGRLHKNQAFAVEKIAAFINSSAENKKKAAYLLHNFVVAAYNEKKLAVFCNSTEMYLYAGLLFHVFPSKFFRYYSFCINAFTNYSQYNLLFISELSDMTPEKYEKNSDTLLVDLNQLPDYFKHFEYTEFVCEQIAAKPENFEHFVTYFEANFIDFSFINLKSLVQDFEALEKIELFTETLEFLTDEVDSRSIIKYIENELFKKYTAEKKPEIKEQLASKYLALFEQLLCAIDINGAVITGVIDKASEVFSGKAQQMYFKANFISFLLQNKKNIVKDKFDAIDKHMVKLALKFGIKMPTDYLKVVAEFIKTDTYLKNLVLPRYKTKLPDAADRILNLLQ
ncbi:MAG TPA: hypothetical protein DCQ31_00690 [Bacteroidales bacterium]|nr:hypothetical protein [Bacteroidales bacterium]